MSHCIPTNSERKKPVFYVDVGVGNVNKTAQPHRFIAKVFRFVAFKHRDSRILHEFYDVISFWYWKRLGENTGVKVSANSAHTFNTYVRLGFDVVSSLF